MEASVRDCVIGCSLHFALRTTRSYRKRFEQVLNVRDPKESFKTFLTLVEIIEVTKYTYTYMIRFYHFLSF